AGEAVAPTSLLIAHPHASIEDTAMPHECPLEPRRGGLTLRQEHACEARKQRASRVLVRHSPERPLRRYRPAQQSAQAIANAARSQPIRAKNGTPTEEVIRAD